MRSSMATSPAWRVKFEAELAEGAHGLRDTKERWTFEREINSQDPNWRLAAVAQA